MPAPLLIRAGELRHLVTIAQANTSEDAFGGADPAMAGSTRIATVWAKIETLTMREIYAAQQKVSQVTHRVTIRWIDGIVAGMLVWFRGRQFQIQDVSNVNERNIRLEMLCLERDDSAREEGTSDPFPEGQGTLGGPSNTAPYDSSPGDDQKYVFIADGTTKVFTLPVIPSNGVMLFWDDLLQNIENGDYSISGAQITLGRMPAPGDNITVLVL